MEKIKQTGKFLTSTDKKCPQKHSTLLRLYIIAKTKCAKIENETSKTSLFFASFFLLASGFVKCKLNAD